MNFLFDFEIKFYEWYNTTLYFNNEFFLTFNFLNYNKHLVFNYYYMVHKTTFINILRKNYFQM